jgi:hypothetical protein
MSMQERIDNQEPDDDIDVPEICRWCKLWGNGCPCANKESRTNPKFWCKDFNPDVEAYKEYCLECNAGV